jgi:hypothetical protein
MPLTVKHHCPRFEGPYFSGSPRRLGEDLWKSEVAAHGPEHPAAVHAGGWFAIGLGERQTQQSLRLLREAERMLRMLGNESACDLGVNLAAQGLGLVQMKRPNSAGRKLREAFTLLDELTYEHLSDLMVMSTRLAAVELELRQPMAGLQRLHAMQTYQRFCKVDLLLEAANVRGRLVEALRRSEHEWDVYMAPGQHHRSPEDVYTVVHACCSGINALMLINDERSAKRLASTCLCELLNNRNLSSSDIQEFTLMLRVFLYGTEEEFAAIAS